MNKTMKELYESTAEDLLFGIGMLQMPGIRAAPYIHIHYATWPREKLELVRDTFQGGIILVHAKGRGSTRNVYLGTREKAVIQCDEGKERSVLRGPAWSAHLEAVEHGAFTIFETHRRRFGGYLLLLQTPKWEFMTGVDDRKTGTIVGVVLPREMEMPPNVPFDRRA